MPTRTSPATGAVGEVQPVYRKFSFGSLVDLFMLDLRQYRSEQPLSPADAATINDPTRTMPGAQQSAWLQGNLAPSSARWQLMGNSVQIVPVIVVPSLLDQQTQFLLFPFFQIPHRPRGHLHPPQLLSDSQSLPEGHPRGRSAWPACLIASWHQPADSR